MHRSLSFLFCMIKLLNYLRQRVLFVIQTNVKEQQQIAPMTMTMMMVLAEAAASEATLIACNAITYYVDVFLIMFRV